MFDENIEELDFAVEPEKCRNQINRFVEKVTQNHIKDLLPSGSINRDTKVVLANAAFFKGNWHSKFDKKATQKKIFYEHSRAPVLVDMMKQRGYFNYGVIEKLKTSFLEMPYAGEDGSISMFVFLPVFTVNAIDELLENITPEMLDEALSGGQPQDEVDVELPKISFERKFKLAPVRSNMVNWNTFLI